jgi:uncharacterized membrane protein YidH (DUF202 family)
VTTSGLQHERTALAWQRTSLAMLANGILLLIHRAHGGGVPLSHVILAGLAGTLAAMTFALGRRRRRTLRTRPVNDASAPAAYVMAVGFGQALLGLLVVLTLW